MNCADFNRSVVLTVSKGLSTTATPLARASSASPLDSRKPPVITSARTPRSMAGSWIVGRSPQTTTSRVAGYDSIRAVNPSALIAPTMSSNSSR